MRLRPAPTSMSSCPTYSTGRPGRAGVCDRTVSLGEVPDGCRVMADREALMVLVQL
ncbi:hypothetical protein ACIQ6K_03800 [Streptomyces sp. NPDC096354]|uniref:hypothetical protein n=1 Tax=Streptomyces sp. NPDC096354 TaxID=3366088 RepID=UPI00382C9DB8